MTYKEFIDKLVDYVRQSGDWKVQDLIPKMVFSNKVQTMATNAHNIFINPDFAASLTMPQVVGVLWHESLHDLYDHHKVPWAVYDISSGLSPQQWHQLTNVAMDLIINDTVLACGQELPSSGVFRDDFPFITDDMTTSHQVFKALLKHLQDNYRNDDPLPPRGGGGGGGDPLPPRDPRDDDDEGGPIQDPNDKPIMRDPGEPPRGGDPVPTDEPPIGDPTRPPIRIPSNDPIAKAMKDQEQQEKDDRAVANEPPQSPKDSDDSSTSPNSISKKEKDERQSQINKDKQSIDNARKQLDDEEKKLRDRLDKLLQDPVEQKGDDTDSETAQIQKKLKELEDKRKELDEKSDELDRMQKELDSLDTKDSDDNDKDDSKDDQDGSSSDDASLSKLLKDLVEDISTEVIRDLTAVDRTKRAPIPALRDFQVTWIDKVFSRVGRYLAQQNRDRTFSRPARRNPYGLPDSEYKTPQKGSLIRDYKPTVCFYLDASISMYWKGNGPEIIRKKLAQKAQLLKDTRSIVIPFSDALGTPIDVTAEFPHKPGDGFVSGTNLNNVINDINKNSFDVSVIITDATEKLYIDRIDRNRDVVIVLPKERSIVGDTSRRNIEIIQQEDLLE